MPISEETDINRPLLADRPLFGYGVSGPVDRIYQTLIVVITCLFVIITTIRTFVPYPSPADVFFALCIIMACGSNLTLIYWYRQGDLDPKFKKMIYYNTLLLILLCICANIVMHR